VTAAIERPRLLTPVDLRDLYAALDDETATFYTREPTLRRESLLVLCAHVWHETGAGESCYCYSLAGIKSTPGDGCDWCTLPTFEYVAGQRVNMPQKFRAFATLEDGVANYVRTMRGPFGLCWPFVEAGDPAGFAQALHDRHYYTAPVADYVAAMRRRYAEVDAALPAPDVLETVRDERSVEGPVKS
jgi:hypothetical protein